ncbi:MAG: proton-conducting transporter membrane subunit, partial [Verrucomicrobiales bacterium]
MNDQPPLESTAGAALGGANPLLLGLALLAPLLPLMAGVAASTIARSRHVSGGARASGVAARLSLGSFAAAAGAALALAAAGPAEWSLPGLPWLPLGIRVDVLTVVMLVLVSFLGAVVTRYARNYLAGDPGQARFSQWLSLTVASVLTLIVSGNLLLFTLAWMATSLCLHRLLLFYGDRPAAVLAARKKFLISRLGDACLIAGLALAWQCFGTWEFGGMFAAAESARASGDASACLGWLAWLLVVAALLKSAQFPFHSWLPDTMETPTPVSALMHAGIINAGGFLVVRLGPIIVNEPAALNTLAVAGAFTALFASVVMLTQTSVKRSLAYSTVAQMGFM